MTTIADHAQATLDAEDADRITRKLRKLATEVRKLQLAEASSKEQARDSCRQRSLADKALSAAVEAEDTTGIVYLQGVRRASRAAEAAREAEVKTRQDWQQARRKRREAQDMLQAEVVGQFRRYELFEWGQQQTNGEAEAPDRQAGGENLDSPPVPPSPLSWLEPATLIFLFPGGAVEVAYTPGATNGRGLFFTSPRFEFTGEVIGGRDYHCVSVEMANDLLTKNGDLTAFAEGLSDELVRQAAARTRRKPPDVSDTNIPDPGPLAVECPQCHRAVGEKCRNYKGQNCAPHRERIKAAKEVSTQPPEDTSPTATEEELRQTQKDLGFEWDRGEPSEVAGPPLTDPWEPDGEPLPAGLDVAAIVDAYLPGKLAKGKDGLAVSVTPFEFDGRLWVYTGGSDTGAKKTYNVLPLLPASEFEDLYPGYPTRFRPGPLEPGEGGVCVETNATPATTHEGALQWWTGVVVRVGRKEYAVMPAGEERTFVTMTEVSNGQA